MDADRYGSFDGRFVGISLELDRDSLERGSLPWAPLDGLKPAGPSPILSRLDPETALEDLLQATAIAHEVRHFHDFMLSPLGSKAILNRLLGAANAFPLVPRFAAHDGVLPVPLSVWIEMPADQRDAYWRRASRLAAATGTPMMTPIEIPFAPSVGIDGPDLKGRRDPSGRASTVVFDEDLVDEATLLVASQFARAEFLLGAVVVQDLQWQPGQLFEAGALLVQLHQIALLTNEEVMEAALASFMTEDSDYATVLERMARIFGVQAGSDGMRLRVSPTEILLVSTFALLGSCRPHDYYGQSVVRFSVIAQHLHKEPPLMKGDSVRDQYEKWDRVLVEAGFEFEPTLPGLEASMATDLRLAEMLAEDLQVRSEQGPAATPKLVCIEFLRARVEVCARFLEDPDAYIRPGRYLSGLDRLPRPAVQVSFPGSSQTAARELLKDAGWDCLDVDDRRQVTALPPEDLVPGSSAMPLDALALSADMVISTEAIFSANPAVAEAGGEILAEMFGDRLPMMRVSRPPLALPSSLGEGHRSFVAPQESPEQLSLMTPDGAAGPNLDYT